MRSAERRRRRARRRRGACAATPTTIACLPSRRASMTRTTRAMQAIGWRSSRPGSSVGRVALGGDDQEAAAARRVERRQRARPPDRERHGHAREDDHVAHRQDRQHGRDLDALVARSVTRRGEPLLSANLSTLRLGATLGTGPARVKDAARVDATPRRRLASSAHARVAKLADAPDSGSGGRKAVLVRLQSRAPASPAALRRVLRPRRAPRFPPRGAPSRGRRRRSLPAGGCDRLRGRGSARGRATAPGSPRRQASASTAFSRSRISRSRISSLRASRSRALRRSRSRWRGSPSSPARRAGDVRAPLPRPAVRRAPPARPPRGSPRGRGAPGSRRSCRGTRAGGRRVTSTTRVARALMKRAVVGDEEQRALVGARAPSRAPRRRRRRGGWSARRAPARSPGAAAASPARGAPSRRPRARTRASATSSPEKRNAPRWPRRRGEVVERRARARAPRAPCARGSSASSWCCA